MTLPRLCYALALSIAIGAGCANLRETNLAGAVRDLGAGAAGVAAVPVNPFPWIEVAAGVAGITAAAIGGKKAYAKVRRVFGKGD